VVIALLWSGAISASGPQTWQSRFGLIWPPACLVMVVETLLGFNKYSGRARHRRSAARSAPASAAGPAWLLLCSRLPRQALNSGDRTAGSGSAKTIARDARRAT